MRILFITLLSALLAACASDSSSGGDDSDCSNSIFVGTWDGNILSNADSMTFSSSCSGTSTYCAGTFTYPNLTSSSGNISVNVTSSNGNTGCLPLGETTCSYSITSGSLTFSCGGGGSSTYVKQ